MNNAPHERLLDPDAPTSPRLRSLLERLVPKDISEETEERLEARIQETLDADAAKAPAVRAPLRAVK